MRRGVWSALTVAALSLGAVSTPRASSEGSSPSERPRARRPRGIMRGHRIADRWAFIQRARARRRRRGW